ncbi:hypothetical protein GLOTRDRAFT_63126 [Gloeophyllum trabeum ATCC 11539]|uniref:Uncharacterized protein n=1 Tax=Gloeophyllum trabeum (strain ATCC 11539 / FP-39264 / Madison 617) TaxID=670483 RepID=S7Q1Y7_GLOTA|nr:uncharacterized protein GLOTRDRAFT_63126 [Gloeophyllum trabeum ATCC 11539]EPQ53532.1 hypothetical protein GLOTRDRAFT_63126 [Gloeophyllum trabeum ATCC 11539]
MSNESVTSHRHNDYVGTDANSARIPGAEKATTGHSYTAVFPKETPSDHQQQSAPRRVEEHLPPPTGRDRPPAHDQGPSADQIRAVQNSELQARAEGGLESLAQPRVGDVVIDRDPYAERTAVGDTLTGATSQDVHSGLGHPGAGMSSKEMHHDGQQKRKRQEQGTDQFGNGQIPREEPPY